MTGQQTLVGTASVVSLHVADGLTELVALGGRVIPLNGTKPIKKGWPEAPLVSAERARQWLEKGQNLGLVTGHASGLVVVDVDPRNGGAISLADLETRLGALPPTLICDTGGGGQHLYFRWYKEACSSKPAHGIDFQADGRCVVLPPSVHPETGALYAWREPPGHAHIAELPVSWRKAMTGHAGPGGRLDSDGGPIPEGHRNETLFRMACDLYRQGAGESQVHAALSEANALRCEPPLAHAEVRKIGRSAYQYKPTEQSFLTRWQQCLTRSEVGRAEWAVGMALSMFSDTNGGNCFPSQEVLSEVARYGRTTTGKALNNLESAGWIERYVIPRAGNGFSHGYKLRIPEASPKMFTG